MHALRLLYILVPYVCDVSRLAFVYYTHFCDRHLALSGHFPSINLYIVISLSTVYILFGLCRRDSHITGVC